MDKQFNFLFHFDLIISLQLGSESVENNFVRKCDVLKERLVVLSWI